MNLIENKKFEEEFIEDLILYGYYNELIKQQKNYINRSKFITH
jgi:hypothetical protein